MCLLFIFFDIFLYLLYLSGRMALLVTLFLVLVNIFNTVTTNTPKAEGKILKWHHNINKNVDYHYITFFILFSFLGLTAIEAWMLACILFVFGTLTEYAGILFAVGLDPTAEECIDEDESKITNGGGRNLGSQNIKNSPQALPYKWYFSNLIYYQFLQH